MGVLHDKFSKTEVGVGVMVGVSCGVDVFVGSDVGVGATSSVGVFVYATCEMLSSTGADVARHPERTLADKKIKAIQKSVD